MPRAVVIGAWLVLIACAGCGGDDAATRRPDTAADRAAVQRRVATYLRHYAAGDGQRACAQFTPALRARSERRAAVNGDGSCAAVLSALGPELVRAVPPGRRARFVRELGDPAGVRVELRGASAEATLARGSSQRLGLVRAGGRWLIDELGLPAR